jgi:hypothetical protein
VAERQKDMSKPKRVVPGTIIVTVVDGKVSPPSVTIDNQGIVILTNLDLDFYRVRLFTPGDNDHPPMYSVLFPLGVLMLMGGPDRVDQDTHCIFEVCKTNMLRPASAKSIAPASGPGHTIKIGSGGTLRRKGKRHHPKKKQPGAGERSAGD